ncbi:MAG: flagellar hook-length control protein FliK [Allorhizobium sp.]
MIDIGIAGKVQSPDLSVKAGSATSTGSGEKAGSGGDFFDALADAGHQGRKIGGGKQHSNSTKAGESADAGATVEADAEENGVPGSAKPIIEISRRNRHAATTQPPVVDADALNLPSEKQREEAETQSASSQARIAKRLARDDGMTASMKNGAAPDGGQMDAIGEAVDLGKVGKTKSSKDRDTAQGTGTDAEDGSLETDSGVSDVLSLLTGSKAELAQAGQAGPAAGQAASAISVKPDRGERGQNSSEESLSVLKSLTSTISDTATGPDAPDGAAERQGDADHAFRFVRADGKGQTLSMRVAATEDKAAHFETGTANEGGQTVAVLDARRYLAPASNAASITAAMVGDSEWAHAIQPGSELANALTQSNSGKVVNTLKIQMSPIELGNVTATLRLTGDELTVHLTVENRAAFKHLNDDQSDMLKALRSQGFAVDQIQISLSGAADRGASDAGQSGAQGQQAPQSGGQNGTGGGGRHEPFTQPDRGGTAMGRTGDDAGTVQTAGGDAGTAGGLRPDHVYI